MNHILILNEYGGNFIFTMICLIIMTIQYYDNTCPPVPFGR